mmetsp:Transcript_39992/g.60048  ORF Transcript_39992/g.60048 Transcript_39992/m.60048 type:complete len:96 (-) Transcript_39992:258-545(-)
MPPLCMIMEIVGLNESQDVINSRSDNQLTLAMESSLANVAAQNDEHVDLALRGHAVGDVLPERRFMLSLGSDHARMLVFAANASRSCLSKKHQMP